VGDEITGVLEAARDAHTARADRAVTIDLRDPRVPAQPAWWATVDAEGPGAQ